MLPVKRISHATFETPNLERQVEYYSNVIGFAVLYQNSKEAILGSPTGHEVLSFERGQTNRCTKIAFQVTPSIQLADISAGLAKLGLKSDKRSDISPLITQAVTFTDPKGTEIQLFGEQKDTAIPGPNVSGIAPLKLGHIAFSVEDASAICKFYVDALGFQVSDWIEDLFVFLRCGPDHHTVNFVTGDNTFMHHIAYELKDWAHVLRACDILGREKRPIIWGPGRHRVGHNIFIYHRDPDDNIIEFYTELDLMKSEELGYFEPRPWHLTNPQKPKVWTRTDSAPVWGTPPTNDFRRNGNEHLNKLK